MTSMRGRWIPLIVLVFAAALLIASMVWTSSREADQWPAGTPLMGPGWTGPGLSGGALTGDGPVESLAAASQAAGRLGDRWGLTVGEVMQFDNGFYAQLTYPSGKPATEVLIDPRTGTVQLEIGPAMMWNTAYGMRPGRAASTTINGEQAQSIANRWLDRNRPGERAGRAGEFPGYYTLHALRADQVVGMLSVHATTGAVWYHSWHGRFVSMTQHDTD